MRVADGGRSLEWYRDLLGFEVLEHSEKRITLGAGGQSVLFLEVEPGATTRPQHATGLYHVALLVPDRVSLAGRLTRLIKARIRMGAADHDVSEALYIRDPDNNGIEIYRDRPASEWTWEGREVLMRNRPLDYDGILAENGMEEMANGPMPAGTVIGHIHLQVGDLVVAEKFYCDAFGFEPTRRRSDGAIFMSAGNYHHHLAVNVWDSLGGPQPPANAAGLVEFEVVLPDRASVEAAQKRMKTLGYSPEAFGSGFLVSDPWQIAMRVRT